LFTLGSLWIITEIAQIVLNGTSFTNKICWATFLATSGHSAVCDERPKLNVLFVTHVVKTKKK
jgi:hypothetical protein